MAIAFRSFTSSNTNNTASRSIALPAGCVSGDVLVFVSDCDGVAGLDTLSGFTDLFGGPVVGSGGSFCGGFQYRVCDGTEPSSYTVNVLSGAERAAFALLCYSGVSNTSPINVSGTNDGGSDASVVFPSGLSTTVNDCVVIAAIAREKGQGGNAIVDTWPSGWTERYDNEGGPGGAGGGSAACAAADFDQATAGTIASETVTTRRLSFWMAAYIALAPESAAATITGTGAINSTVPTISGAGTIARSGSGDVDIPVQTISGAGTVTEYVPPPPPPPVVEIATGGGGGGSAADRKIRKERKKREEWERQQLDAVDRAFKKVFNEDEPSAPDRPSEELAAKPITRSERKKVARFAFESLELDGIKAELKSVKRVLNEYIRQREQMEKARKRRYNDAMITILMS